MNKYYSAFIQDHGLTYDSKEKIFYGKIGDEYQISGTANTFSLVNRLSFHVHVPEERMGEVGQFLFGIKKNYGIQNFQVVGDGIVLTVTNSAKKYISCAEAVANYLSGIGAKGGCPFCGEDVIEEARLVGSPSGIYRAHERCFDEYVGKIAAGNLTKKNKAVSKSFRKF